jgi:hypothetical protein
MARSSIGAAINIYGFAAIVNASRGIFLES